MGKKRQCFIPQRQVNWKKYAYLHNRENNIFYDCDCGKRYVSFPAIYLHFQRKHHKKLATKFDANQCEVIKNQREVIYFYYSSTKRHFLRKQIQKDSNNTQTKCNTLLGSTLSDFFKEETQIQEKLDLIDINKVLLKFEKFVFSTEDSKKENLLCEADILNELPLYFNEFIESEKKLNSQQTNEQYAEICFILFCLARWLNAKKFSNLIVELNIELNLQKG